MKHPTNKHLRAAWLCSLLAISAIGVLSCGGDGTAQDESGTVDTAPVTEAVTEDPRLAVSDGLPEKDYGGDTFTILNHNQTDGAPGYYCMEEEDGDILNDVYFLRQTLVEERFNVDIKSKNFGGIAENVSAIRSAVMAGDDVYDLCVIHQITGGPTLINDHVILDWNDIPYIDISKPWWNRQINETISIEGRQYYIAGYITNPSPFCMFYNPVLAANYDLEDIFTVVNEGRWTLDYLLEITETVTKDLNGDGKWTPDADQYGLTFNNDNQTLNFMYAADICSVIIDENGKPVPNTNTDKMQTLVEKMNMLAHEGNRTSFTTYDTQAADGVTPFKEGRILIHCQSVGDAIGLRDLDIDFSVIPYPKYDEAQEGYYTHVDAWNGMLCIPKSAADTERTGIITEAYAAETWKHVIPVYYDQALSDKYLRDEGSVKMLDTIYEGIVYDFGYIFDNWNGCTWTLPNLLSKKKTDLASHWKSIEKKVTKHYEKLYEAVLEDE